MVMTTWYQFHSIRSRLIFWLLIVSLVPLLVFGAVVFVQRVDSIKREAFNKLTAIRDLKAQQINNWLDERVSDLNTVSKDYETKLM